jgi:outer membrane usher protein
VQLFDKRSSFLLLVILFVITFKSAECDAATKNVPDDFVVTLKLGREDYQEFVHITQDYKGDIFVPRDALMELGIKETALTRVTIINDIKYVNISNINQLSYNLDKANLKLEINAPVHLMGKQNIDLAMLKEQEASHLTPAESSQVINEGHGAFMNYDLTLTNSNRVRSIASFQDFNYFTDHGVFNQTFFGRFRKGKNKAFRERNEIIRLDTSFAMNNENSLAQLKIGDGVSKPADWSTAARFAGVQYASNFSIRPNIITYPLFNYSSIADLPSTLDLYAANQAPLFSGDIRPGEFDLANIPLPTGKGEVVIKARDINGRIETFVLPYYITPQLLKPGLTDFFYAIGTQRFGYGTRKHDRYKYLISNFDYSLGVTENFTNSVHFESQKTASIGDTVYYKLLDTIILNASIASNLKSSMRDAQRYSIGFDYVDKRYFFNSTVAFGGSNFIDTYSRRYVNRGGAYSQNAMGYSHEELGSISVNYLTYPVVTRDNTAKYGVIGLNYDKKFFNNFYFRINAGSAVRGPKNKFIIFSLNFNLDDKNYAQVSTGRQNNRDYYNISLNSPIPSNLGWGYYAAFGKEGRGNNYNLRLSKNTSKVNSSLYLYQYGATGIQQLNFAGSIVAMDSNIFVTQPISDSFAIVKTGDINGVPIYSNNQLISYTNSRGVALVPNLPAYVKSKISLDESQIPLGTNITGNQLGVIPKWKSGALVNFNLKETKTMQMNLVDINDKPVKHNMDVTIDGIDDELFTGYNGLVFIRDIKNLAHFRGKACSMPCCCYFDAPLTNKQHELIDLGNIICK